MDCPFLLQQFFAININKEGGSDAMSDIVIDKEQDNAQQRAERYERYLKELQGKKDQKDKEQK